MPKTQPEDRRSQAKPTIYCTIATARELPQALLLRDSLLAAQGAVDFHLLLVEHPTVVARLRAQLSGVHVLGPDEIGCPQWLHMAFCYDRGEYSAALKGALLRTLLGTGQVVYFDANTEVFSSLRPLQDLLQAADVVITARGATDATGAFRQDRLPTREELLEQSEFDFGFLGLHAGAAAERLLAWWQDLLVEGIGGAESHTIAQLSTIGFVAMAPRLQVLHSLRYNLANQRPGSGELQWDGTGVPQTPEGSLLFLRYAGSPPADKDSALARLWERYRQQLATSSYQRFAAQPYSFGRYAEGPPIPAHHRHTFARLPRANRQQTVNPFAEEHYLAQVAAQHLHTSCAHCQELEARLHSLPYSLVGYTGKALGLLAPRARDRIYNALQGASAQHANLRYYAFKALDLMVPGSRDRVYNVMKAAAASENPKIRATAAVLFGALGVRV